MMMDIQVSHKTCRFYFVLERTSTTLGEYLQRCLESDLVRERENMLTCTGK